jgi:serine O-acetyltransferase
LEAQRRFHRLPGGWGSLLNVLLTPAFIAVLLHRLAHCLHGKGWRLLARLAYLFNTALTGADIAPSTRIGEAWLLLHAPGTFLNGRLGRNVTCTAAVGLGGTADRSDVGGGPGLPSVGDGVYLGARCGVLGPIRVGDGAVIGAHTLVVRDVPPGATVFGVPGRVVKTADGGATAV